MLIVRQAQMQQLGSACTNRQNVQPCEGSQSFVAIRLVDEEGQAMVGASYRVVLPDQSVFEGCLDADGAMRVDGIVSGNCQIAFPQIDGREWRPA